jgi:transposase-like protein
MRKKKAPNCKVEDMDTAKICHLYSTTDKSIRNIAQDLNCSPTLINKILRQCIPPDDYETLKKGKRIQNNHYNKKEIARLQTA